MTQQQILDAGAQAKVEVLRLWSVTTLIREGLGTSGALVNWNARTPAETAFDKFNTLKAFVEDGDRDGAVKWLMDARWRKSGEAMARGTDLHKAAEARALGQVVEVSPEIEPYLAQYDRFLSEFQPEFLLAESPVYAPRYGWAGTLDAIMKIDGKTVIADLKTTPHAPDSGRMRPPYEEAALQLVAYKNCEFVGLLAERRMVGNKRYYAFDPSAVHEKLPATDGAVVVTISPYDVTVTPMRVDEEVFRAWRHVVESARWRLETSKNVVGPQVTPRKAVAA